VQLIRPRYITAAATLALLGCGSDPEFSGPGDFVFEENFEFEETANNTSENNTTPNTATNNTSENNGSNNPLPPEACPTELIGTAPGGTAAIDRGGAGPVVAYLSGDTIETRRRDRMAASWERVTSVPVGSVRDVEVAGIIEGRTSQFWMATADDDTTLYLCSVDGCGEITTFPFADAVELYSTSDSVAYIAGVSREERIPTFVIRFFSQGRTGRHAFAEALSSPTQFGLAPLSRPDDPLFRTEFRAAWDTGDIPLSFVSVNTSLLMELEPECNRLDLLGGRVVPLPTERGILVAASGEGGSAITFDACDGIAPPRPLEASRGLTDFDVAMPEVPDEVVNVYWIARNSLWGTTFDAGAGEPIEPVRRIATVPSAQAVRATVFEGRHTVVVTTEDEVLGVVDDPSCSEFAEF
jgi:hypothetical protein